MKASSGTSRTATVDRTQAPVATADGGADDAALHCKETLLSSSDTDDGDTSYSKLVIDLDAASVGADPSPSDPKQAAVPQPAPTEAAAPPARSDGGVTKCRNVPNSAVDGTKPPPPSSSSSHRASKPPHSAELSNGGAAKGLKMKIRCSQSGGGGQPPRHEVSHFHPVVGSPPPEAAAAARSKSGGAQDKARGASGTHRRDRTLGKDRGKDRSASDRHQTAASAAGSAADPGRSASDPGTAAGPVAATSAGMLVVAKDVSQDAVMVKTDDVDLPSSATLPPHDPYEFNASSEDSISCPAKKMKFEQVYYHEC